MEFCVFSHYSDAYIINSIRFTARELDILSGLTSGHGMKAIAALLHISPKTVESHIRNIMLKLQCTSKEQILKFIEQSEFHQQLIEHYRNLYAQNYLDNILQQISRQNQSSSKTCIIICHLDPQNTQKCCRLVEVLRKAGIKVILKRQLIHTWDIDSNFVIIESEKNLDLIHSIPKKIQRFTIVLATSPLDIDTDCQLIQHKNYYDTVIKILEILYPDKIKDVSLNKDATNFLTISMRLKSSDQVTVFRYKHCFYKFLLIGVGTCFLIGYLIFIFFEYKVSPIPSNIPAFNKTYLLHRRSSLKNMDLLLNKQTDIQVVALIGPGGSGKTTLARQYAQKQKSKVIYEINAETKNSRTESLKSLSYMLANTSKLREELSFIHAISNSAEREKQQLQFIQSRLKAMKSWCLIFDNVEQFQDIRAIFPSDVRNWGKGKVILTTRNKQIQTVEEITPAKSFIMEELNLKAEHILFNQIFYEQAHPQIPIEKDQEIQTFLQQLPPFPLDISTAAHYIKITQISFDEYLAKLKQIDLHFDTLQHQILKENTHYDQTRYQIISTAFEKILRNHPEFKKLFFLICMVDSQNILKEFLYQLASNRNEADQFILQLRQHSLITEKQKSVSIHRSIQKIGLAYISKILSQEESENYLQNIIQTFTLLEKIAWLPNTEKPLNNVQKQCIHNHLKKIYANIHLFDFSNLEK